MSLAEVLRSHDQLAKYHPVSWVKCSSPKDLRSVSGAHSIMTRLFTFNQEHTLLGYTAAITRIYLLLFWDVGICNHIRWPVLILHEPISRHMEPFQIKCHDTQENVLLLVGFAPRVYV